MTSQRMRRFSKISRRFWRVWGGLEGKTATLPIQFRPDLMHDVSAIADVMETHGTLLEAAIITLVSEIMAQELGQWTGEFKNDLRTMIIDILLDWDLQMGEDHNRQMIFDLHIQDLLVRTLLIKDDKMTAIIVPHSSLLNNHIHAAEEAKIPCIRWTVETLRVPSGTKFIFLALESATSPKWEEFLKQNETRIVRSVIDEAHEILTMESFRQNFDRIHMLASHRHQ
ncbi:hypothetical protein M422DRAFT_248583 [Sphaerobolus stellatus SS14]|nr:hypothetical protein M422DRAFT_248583 [Sphaerobolus stellatus SS14]